jgi:archaellum component FlaF (FlaF/FlaG flagellin family)
LGKLNVYPNPSQGVFQVNIPNSGAEPVQLEVFDMLGNLIVSETISNSQNGIVDLRSRANGSYFIRVLKDDVVWTGRLLKLP